ncbi:MAG: LruC domain-containing protein [Bacteroidetes bacterium]|nr:LruC domain-containing protein [Bacteroidota bacterium]
MRKLLLLAWALAIVIPSIAYAGAAGTKFQLYVPSNNDNNGRNVCIIITAITDSTVVELIDDGTDGDIDDSWSGILNKGQSYVGYIKDGAINDDAGGKADGDYFFVNTNKPALVSMSTNSDWQHDFVPSDSGTMRGRLFYVYSPPTGYTNRDINVFAYEDSTLVQVYDITTVAKTTTGVTTVNTASPVQVVSTNLNTKEDLINIKTSGRDILVPGRTYLIMSSKPVTMQYGSLWGNARDGGGFVPGIKGSSVDSLFYFAIPADNTGEQELRMVSFNDNVTLNLDYLNGSTWTSLGVYNLNTLKNADWVAPAGKKYNLFRAYTNHGKVSLFEANWLETGTGSGTADMYSYTSSENGDGAGKNFVIYLGPPGLESNCVDPFSNKKFSQISDGGLFSHVFLSAYYPGTTVRVQDAATGTFIDTTINIAAGRYIDFKVGQAKFDAMKSGGRKPYLKITATQPVVAAFANWNDNWMCYATSVLAAAMTVNTNIPQTTLHSRDTVSITTSCTNRSGSTMTNTKTEVKIPDGLHYESSNLSSNHGDLGEGERVHSGNDDIIRWKDYQFNHGDSIKVKVKLRTDSLYHDGSYIPNNTNIPVTTTCHGKVGNDTIITQNTAVTNVVNANPNGILEKYILAYEDLKNSSWNDWDVNDFVTSVNANVLADANLKIKTITLNYEALARGSSFDHAFKHKLNITGSWTATLTVKDSNGVVQSGLGFTNRAFNNSGTVTVFPSTKQALPPKSGFFNTNTSENQPGNVKGYTATLSITVNNTSNSLSAFNASISDPFILTEIGNEIHIASLVGNAGNTQNVDNSAISGLPLYGYYLDLSYKLPFDYKWPLEGPNTAIWFAYPNFDNYILSGKSTNANWYTTPDTSKVWRGRNVVTDNPLFAVTSQNRIEPMNQGLARITLQDTVSKFFASPKLVDLDGDNKAEVLIGGLDNNFYAFKSDGTQISGFPINTGGIIRSTAAVDKKSDGTKVIVFGTDNGKLYAVNQNGTALSGFPVLLNTPIKSSPIITDLYGDGNKEIVVFAGNGKLYVYGMDGFIKSGFPVKLQNTVDAFGNLLIVPSPAVGDIDGDGKKEIVIGTSDSTVNVVKTNGTQLAGFPVKLDGMIYSSPIISKLNTTSYKIVAASASGSLYILNTNGTVYAQSKLADGFISSPVIADLNADGTREIIIASTDGRIFNVNANEALSLNWEFKSVSEINSSPVVADVNNDGYQEVTYGAMNGAVYVLDKTGNMDANSTMLFSQYKSWIVSSSAIGDIDGNGVMDMVVPSFDKTIKSFELPGTGSGTEIQWQSLGKDLGNSRFDGVEGTVTTVTDLGAVFNYPNPVRTETTLFRAELPAVIDDIKITVFDLGGELVKTFSKSDFIRNGNYYETTWNLKNDKSKDVANGAYYYIVKATISGVEYTKYSKIGVLR